MCHWSWRHDFHRIYGSFFLCNLTDAFLLEVLWDNESNIVKKKEKEKENVWSILLPVYAQETHRSLSSFKFNVFNIQPLCCGDETDAPLCIWAAVPWAIKHFVHSVNSKVVMTRRDRKCVVRIDGVKGEKSFVVFLRWCPLWQVKLPSPLCSALLYSAWVVAV